MGMNRRAFVMGLAACPVCAGLARAESGPHWTYEGRDGVKEWGRLSSEFRACAVGSEQSPVDLRDAIKADIGDLTVEWRPEAYKIVNNGHTIQADVGVKCGATLGGRAFTLKQFHFHTPSEHALDGARTEMEAHFVHADPQGQLMVVGMFMKPGAGHKEFAAIMAAAPRKEGAATLSAPIDPAAFLPQSRERFRYEGSLTTPPCSETVDWNIFAEPIEVAAEDIAAFKARFPMNARPLQAANRRFILKN